MTIEEFGSEIKLNYPQYKNRSDLEVGEAMLKKYPVYQSKITEISAMKKAEVIPEKKESALDIVPTIGKGVGETAIGALKGVGSTLSGLSSLGQRGLEKTVGAGLRKVGIGEEPLEKTAGEITKEKFFTPEGTAQKVGFGAEQLAEWILPSTKLAKLEKGMKLSGRMVTEGSFLAGLGLVQKGKVDEKTKTEALASAVIGAAFPLFGAGLKVFGKGMIKSGKRIQQTVIKPSKRDIKDGFKIENLTKYDLGGNLNQTLAKTTIKMNQLGKELKSKLAKSKKNVDLNDVYKKTVQRTLRKPAETFGGGTQIKSALKTIRSEIERIEKSGIVDVPTAQMVKRKAGENGAWAYNMMDREARAKEQVYTIFYQHIKKAIEKSSPKGVKGINKQLSEIIPIHNAVIRRIPVNDRNQAIGLLDTIGLTATIFDPKGLALVGARRLSASGKFGKAIIKAGEKISDPKNVILKRFMGN